jgi:Protein of unknown function (DUF2855)
MSGIVMSRSPIVLPALTGGPAARHYVATMDFEVRRDDLRTHRFVDERAPAVGAGQVLLHVDHAALTANNITYGAFGEALGYWSFFPAEDGWGRVPVWGFADVESSAADGISEGERFYGYFPMSTHLLVTPGRITPASFVDVSEHRAALPPIYNQYVRFADRLDENAERVYAVLRPLFATSFLIDDWLADASFFGATRVVIASASSKTALALAASLAANREIEVVGLTSPSNIGFVQSSGYYDHVVAYDDVVTLDADAPTVFVDMGGDARVVRSVHAHFGDALRYSCQVGATHWEHVGATPDLRGPPPRLFFAPDQAQRRLADWGGAGFEERLGSAWQKFTSSTEAWLRFDVRRGPDAVAAAFDDVLEGRVPPDHAVVISLDG